MTDALKDLFRTMREHPGFNELISQIPPPSIPRFTTAKIAESDKTYIELIFKSGKREQHNQWLALLTGKPPKENND